MQLQNVLIRLLLAAFAVQSASVQDEQCGYIDEVEMVTLQGFAVPTEHQWVARITYAKGHESKLPHEGCLGVLISKRNVLASAHCFVRYDWQADAYSVQLGVWNKSSKAHQVSCNNDGYCVLPAQDIPLAEIAIHPEYDPLTLKHSLAVLRLQHDAKLTPTVMPICMPNESTINETLVGQLFVVAGLPVNGELKQKYWVDTISRPFCQKTFPSLVTSSTTVCGYQNQEYTFYVGAPLVGIQVHLDEPQNFFLAGILLDSKPVEEHGVSVASYLDVRPYLSFIKRNSENLIVRN